MVTRCSSFLGVHVKCAASAFTALYSPRNRRPFFVFQMLCVLLWSLDDYWYYSLFTLVMLVPAHASPRHATSQWMARVGPHAILMRLDARGRLAADRHPDACGSNGS